MENNIEPTSLGWGSEPQSKKSKTWLWIVVAVLVLCLCLAAVVVGIYLFLTLRPAEVVTSTPGGSGYPSAPTMAPLATQFPAPTESIILPDTLVVEPFYPGDPFDHSLFDLVPLYEWSPEPGVYDWDVMVSAYDSVVFEQGWCTGSEEILAQNFEHLEFIFTADGEELDLDSLYMYEFTDEGRYCRSYLGIIQSWPPGDHLLIIEMIVDEPINDGWEDYVAGQYIDQFIIYATP